MDHRAYVALISLALASPMGCVPGELGTEPNASAATTTPTTASTDMAGRSSTVPVASPTTTPAPADQGLVTVVDGDDMGTEPDAGREPEMPPVNMPAGDPLEGIGEVLKLNYSKEGGKLDNPLWYGKLGVLVFNDAGPMQLSADDTVSALYVTDDGSKHSLKTVDRQGDLVGLRYPDANDTSIEHIVRFDGQGGFEVIADTYNDHRLPHANDMAVGADGSVYFSQRRGKPDDDYLANKNGPGAIFRASPSGVVGIEVDQSIEAELRNPNGMAVSPDGRTLYVGASDYDTKSHQGVWSFPIQADGSLGQGSFLGKAGRPDGIAVDAAGHIYVSNGSGKDVHVMRPDGMILGTIRLREAAHTNCEFGGGGGTRLYMTTQKSMFYVDLAIPGEIPTR